MKKKSQCYISSFEIFIEYWFSFVMDMLNMYERYERKNVEKILTCVVYVHVHVHKCLR